MINNTVISIVRSVIHGFKKTYTINHNNISRKVMDVSRMSTAMFAPCNIITLVYTRNDSDVLSAPLLIGL